MKCIKCGIYVKNNNLCLGCYLKEEEKQLEEE